MNDYMVFFELYGKKMKIHIQATDEDEAKMRIMDDIIFHKVVNYIPPEPEEENNIFSDIGNNDTFDNLMNIFKKK